jgi:pilus assembly protein CpaC
MLGSERKSCALVCVTMILLAAGSLAIAGAQAEQAGNTITLVRGYSKVINAPWPAGSVAVTDPKVADVQVLSPVQILLQGIKVGTTDLSVWSQDGKQVWQRQLIVKREAASVQQLVELFPNASLEASEIDEVLVVRGVLHSADQVEQLHQYLERTGVAYVDMTSVAGIQQVQLQVRVAEVSRSALKTLGVNGFQTDDDFFWGQRVGPVVPEIGIGAAPGQIAGDNLPFITPNTANGIVPGSSSPVTLFAGFPNSNLEIFLQALADNQYMRILANPTLVALSGEDASFLAGGEFPVPVVQSSGLGAPSISVEWKEFGVRLRFRPVVLGDGGIRLHAMQEVSELTDVGAVVIQGFVIHALTTRRSEATLELKSGQSFAMAGLLRQTDEAANSRIPGLGDLPIIGTLFRSVRYQNQETELIILVTASLVEPMSSVKPPPLPGATYTPPNDWELYVEGRLEGKAPAKVDAATAEWLREMGLDQLVGPGAWDSYSE